MNYEKHKPKRKLYILEKCPSHSNNTLIEYINRILIITSNNIIRIEETQNFSFGLL
jgi:predicted choloylglycine hydrolase